MLWEVQFYSQLLNVFLNNFFCRLHLEVSIFFSQNKKTFEIFLNQIGLKFLCIMHAHHI